MIIQNLDNTGVIPQAFGTAWTPSQWNQGIWRWVWTPTNASTHASWRPTGAAVAFWCFFSTNDANGAGIWLEYVPATQTHSLVLARASDGNVIVGARRAFTWNALQGIEMLGNLVSGAANAAFISIANAATGNGQANFTRDTILPGANLTFGQWGGTFTLQASTISDVDDTAAIAVSRSGSVAATSTIAIAGLQRHVRGGSVAATSTAIIGAVTVSRSGSVTATSTIAIAGLQRHVRSGSVTATSTSTIAAGPATSFATGAYGAQRVLFGTAAGTVSVTLDTASSGSTVFACVGGRLADLTTVMTDSRGNTWTLLYTEEYARWAGYGIRVYRCIGLSGGTGHVFSQQFGQTAGFDECTIAVYEQRGAAHVAATSMVERGIASSILTGSVSSQTTCAWLVLFSGDAPTGATAVLSPSNGLTILDQSTGIDHPNGYVPIVILKADKGAGLHQATIGITPSQGAIVFDATIQAAAVVSRSGSVAATSTIAIAGLQRHVRSGSVTATSTIAIAGLQRHVRSGSVTATSTIAAVGVGVESHVRSGSVTTTSALTSVGLQRHVRDGIVVVTSSMTSSLERAGALSRSGAVVAVSTVTSAGLQQHRRAGIASTLSAVIMSGSQRHVRTGVVAATGTTSVDPAPATPAAPGTVVFSTLVGEIKFDVIITRLTS